MTATINNQSLAVKEYQNQRVVTFSDIDIVHERPEGTAKRNFTTNKEHFIEGEDYFKIAKNQKDEIRTLEIPNRGIVVLTEFGYLLLVKSLTDKLAWKVQRELVKGYFRAKENKHPKLTTDYPALDQSVYHLQQSMKNAINCIERQGYQLGEHEDRIAALEQSITATPKPQQDFTELAREYLRICNMGTNEFREWAKKSIISISSKEGVHTNSVYRRLYSMLNKECCLDMWRVALKDNADCLYYTQYIDGKLIRKGRIIYNIFDAVTKGHITWGHMDWRNEFAKLILEWLIE